MAVVATSASCMRRERDFVFINIRYLVLVILRLKLFKARCASVRYACHSQQGA